MMTPNFFIVGAPKCGTTALVSYLQDHPNLFLSNPKEPCFFDKDLYRDIKMTPEAYYSLFEKADEIAHKAVGESSVSYLFSQCAVAEILKFNPEARFIAMLRNPLELVPSWHSQKVFEGRENILDFAAAWRAEADRRNGKRPSPSGWEIKTLLYSQWGLLGDQVERLLSQVPRERVMLILFEDFTADTAKVYRQVLSFLGLPDDGRSHFPRVNEGKQVLSPRLQQSLAFVKLNAEKVKNLLGITRAGGVVNALFAWNSRSASRKPLPEDLHREMSDFYRQDVQKLSSLLGRDLSHWLTPQGLSQKPEPSGAAR